MDNECEEGLRNPPLIEAIFELRWELEGQDNENEPKIDPSYQIMVGRMYDLVNDVYPIYEQLPAASVPDEISPYVIQHRFRTGANKWPLIQIGPGIASLNVTEDYTWEDFEKRILTLLDWLFEARKYPGSDDIRINGLLLRYIDAREFDYSNDIFAFLNDKMKIYVEIQDELFESKKVVKDPLNFQLNFMFPSSRPPGRMRLALERANVRQQDALVWQTMVQSIGDDAPKDKAGVKSWATEAHELTHEWFCKLTKEIREEFK
jgi:uncharacterized protein (TIGR04255 family)